MQIRISPLWAARAAFVLPFALASWAAAQTTYTVTDLGSLNGSNSYAKSMNGSGQVVGYANVGNPYHAFLYSNGTIQDLNSLLAPGSGWIVEGAAGINDAGEIVAGGQPVNGGNEHALLLTPTPEPGACGVVLLASLGLLRRRRGSRNQQ